MYMILGVDPGSGCTGYGLVSGKDDEFSYVDSGIIRMKSGEDRHIRLKRIFLQIEDLITKYSPTHFAIENVFYSKNARSTMVLGEARGAAIIAAALADIPIYEYSAKEIKMAITGNGSADKTQVLFMLNRILRLNARIENLDESDALAVAVCHAFRQREWMQV